MILLMLKRFWRNQTAFYKRKWERSLPFGDNIVDRREKAKLLGLGENTSIYDNSLVLGDVVVENDVWIGPSTILHGLLVVEDKLSSAHALETRVPFLDNDLVDFAMRLPVRMKLRNLDDVIRLDENEPGSKQDKYFQKTNDGKNLLRRVMQRHIPDQITTAQKQGFSAPDASWFKGESMEYVRRTLMGENARIFEYMDKGVLRSLVEEHTSEECGIGGC